MADAHRRIPYKLLSPLTVSTSHVGYGGSGRFDISLKHVYLTKEPCVLAPDNWNMVLGVIQGSVPRSEYQSYYRKLVYERYKADPTPFIDLLPGEQLVLCCTCISPVWCHRTLAARALEWMGTQHSVEVKLCGEIWTDVQYNSTIKKLREYRLDEQLKQCYWFDAMHVHPTSEKTNVLRPEAAQMLFDMGMVRLCTIQPQDLDGGLVTLTRAGRAVVDMLGQGGAIPLTVSGRGGQ